MSDAALYHVIRWSVAFSALVCSKGLYLRERLLRNHYRQVSHDRQF